MKQANSIIHISFMPSMFCKLLLNLTRLPLRNSRQAVHNSTIKKFTIKSGLHQNSLQVVLKRVQTDAPSFSNCKRLRSLSESMSRCLRLLAINRCTKIWGKATPKAIQRITKEALMRLFKPKSTWSTEPSISMKAKSARYINTPGTMGMTLGIERH